MDKTNQRIKNDKNTSNSTAIRSSKTTVVPERKLLKQSGSLEIIESYENGAVPKTSNNNSRPTSQTTARPWSRSSIGSVPPRPDSSLNKRTVTPTKQVTLQAVRRKEESAEPFVDHVDWRSLNLEDGASHRPRDGANSCQADPSQRLPKLRSFNDKEVVEEGEDATRRVADNKPLNAKEMKVEEKEEDDKEKSSSAQAKVKNDDNDDDSDDDDEERKRRAPNELLMEFVDCLMKQEYKVAEKLCKMILLYEPENEEALKFKPLIEEKIQLDIEAENEESDDEEGDSDEDDSDDDDDDDSDDESSSEEDSDGEEDGDGKANFTTAKDVKKPGTSANTSSNPPKPTYHSEKAWPHSLRDPNNPSSSKD